MGDAHKLQAAALLDEASDLVDDPRKQTVVSEALVHAVLHLAEVLEVRQMVLHEQ